MSDSSFVHRYVPGTDTSVTLVLLHGTGGDEDSLIPLSKAVAPDASVLAVRGKVLENGMPRFFRRFAEGVFDIDDLKFRSNELSDFVLRRSAEVGVRPESLTALGYSNGANIASATLLLRPETFRRAVLLRPVLPFRPSRVPDLSGRAILISAGLHDRLSPRASTEELAAVLRSGGAAVRTQWVEADHGLVRDELAPIKEWLHAERRV